MTTTGERCAYCDGPLSGNARFCDRCWKAAIRDRLPPRATPSGAEPAQDVVVRLTTLEATVAREALAAEATHTDWTDADHEVMEAVIAKLEALGVRGAL